MVWFGFILKETMILRRLPLVLVCLSASTVVLNASFGDEYLGSLIDIDEKIMEWVRDQGGFIHRALHVQHAKLLQETEDSDDKEEEKEYTGGRLGLLTATSDIQKGDALFTIPLHLIFFLDYDMKWWDACETARILLYEYFNEEESHGVPKKEHLLFFTSLLENSPTSMLMNNGDEEDEQQQQPLHWSNDAKAWIQHFVVGNELEPKHFGELPTYERECLHDHVEYEILTDDEKAWFQHALEIVYSRGWNHVLVPVYHWLQHQAPPLRPPKSQSDAPYSTSSSLSSSPPNVKHFLGGGDDGDPPYQGSRTSSSSLFSMDRLRPIQSGGAGALEFVAARDIAQGEILTVGTEDGTMMWQHFARYGRTSPSFPQQWTFGSGYDDVEPWSRLAFVPDRVVGDVPTEANKDDGKKPLPKERFQLSWHLVGDFPTPEQRNWLQSHRIRLLETEAETLAAVLSIANVQERQWALDYYWTLRRAIDQAVIWSRGNPYHNETIAQQELLLQQSCASNNANQSDHDGDRMAQELDPIKLSCRTYDSLEIRDDPLDYDIGRISPGCRNPISDQDIYEEQASPYQQVEWALLHLAGDTSTGTVKDSCLSLDGLLHSCLSYRPQVHELIIHHPAQFVDGPIDGYCLWVAEIWSFCTKFSNILPWNW